MANKKLTKDQILEVAKTISINKSHELASMREISKFLNVSVGTIYNYYSNQESLWCEVFNKMWESSENSIKEILNLEIDRIEKIKKLIIIISNDIRSRNGYGYRLFIKLGTNENIDNFNLFNVRQLLRDTFEKVITGNELQKQAKIKIIITLILNGIIEENDKLLDEYVDLVK